MMIDTQVLFGGHIDTDINSYGPENRNTNQSCKLRVKNKFKWREVPNKPQNPSVYCLGTYLFLTTVLVCNDNRMHSVFWLVLCVMKYTVKMDYYNNNYWVLWQLLVTGSVVREELCHFDTMTHMSRKCLHVHDVNMHTMNCLRLA